MGRPCLGEVLRDGVIAEGAQCHALLPDEVVDLPHLEYKEETRESSGGDGDQGSHSPASMQAQPPERPREFSTKANLSDNLQKVEGKGADLVLGVVAEAGADLSIAARLVGRLTGLKGLPDHRREERQA